MSASKEKQEAFLQYVKPDLERRKRDLFPYRFKLRNPLPELSFDPKLLKFPISKESQFEYKPSDLEEKRLFTHHNKLSYDNGVMESLIELHSFELQLEEFVFDMKGVKVSAEKVPHEPLKIDKQFSSSSSVGTAPQSAIESLNPKDQFLLLPVDKLVKQIDALKSHAKSAKAMAAAKSMKQRSDVLETPNDTTPQVDNGSFVKHESIDITTREGQIEAIERSFKLVNESDLQSVRHPLKPELTAVEFFPVFPDFEHWSYDWVRVSFTEDPVDLKSQDSRNQAEAGTLHNLKGEEALIKPYFAYDDPSETCFAYYVPDDRMTQSLLAKRKRSEDQDGDTDVQVASAGKYLKLRDYSYDGNRVSGSWSVFRIIPGSGAFFVPISSELKATKKRLPTGALSHLSNDERPTRIDYTERLATLAERNESRDKLARIMNPQEAEDWAEYYGGGVGDGLD